VIEHIKKVKAASYDVVNIDDAKRRAVLTDLADSLRKNHDIILRENKKDLDLMGKSDPKYDRLFLTIERINAIANEVIAVASLPNPLGKTIEEKLLPNGLLLQKISVPLGVVAVIYESRPNVTVDVFTLCFKTGNACILKGSKDAHYSNTVLVNIVHQVLIDHGINNDSVYLLPPEREATSVLLNATGLVDVCIPRGSKALIEFVRENARIPVIETGAGIVHTYFDISGDAEKARKIIDNAKTRRVSVCNALDTLIIHEKRLSDLNYLLEPLAEKQVEIFADEASYQALSDYPLLHKVSPKDFGQEFLSYKMSIKTVSSIEEAVSHIMQYTSGHSEAIIAENQQAIDYFVTHVDAAVVYVNASTAFTDGAQFGLGAEIGISTQKLHARGPMGLEALTSYKWLVFGNGQIRP
jgi:glutamate-5-semialdehyde dehydrogenase